MDPELIKVGMEIGKEALSNTSVYQDALQPAAKQFGKSLETVAKAVNVALCPISAIVWGYEKIASYLENKVEQKLANVPPENIQTPKANIAVPIIEGMRNVSEDEDLQEIYANLLANAMNRKVAHGVLPSFAEIVKQLTSDEAKLIKYFTTPNIIFPVVQLRVVTNNGPSQEGWDILQNHYSKFGIKAGCVYPMHTPMYLDNLTRLGLIEISYVNQYAKRQAYDEILQDPNTLELKDHIESNPNKKLDFLFGSARLTSFGENFCKACNV